MAYIGYKRVYGFGGLPIKTGEKAISMLSSGIDSPVASFQLLKRGVDLTYVHFHSSPAINKCVNQTLDKAEISLSDI